MLRFKQWDVGHVSGVSEEKTCVKDSSGILFILEERLLESGVKEVLFGERGIKRYSG
jgi:hypothetical protein